MIDIPTNAQESVTNEVEANIAENNVTAIREPKVDAQGRAYGTGRRKDAAARVWIKPGTGKIEVNGSDVTSYFKRPVLRMIINQPFEATDNLNKFDVFCTVSGGGSSGQAGAIRHGISRALDNYNPEVNHTTLPLFASASLFSRFTKFMY